LKRKRNSNYIQQCIKHGNEYYNHEKIKSLAWLNKDRHADKEPETTTMDDRNMEILRKKQEIMAMYNKVSKENKPCFAEDGFYRYSYVKGNNSSMVIRVLESRGFWQELEEKHLTLYSFKWTPTSRCINFD
jgi:ribosomal protein S4